MDSDITITANFIKKKYELKIEVEGKGSVFQEVIKPGIADEYNSGTILKLTALPVDGWVFVEWQGDIQNENNPIHKTNVAIEKINDSLINHITTSLIGEKIIDIKKINELKDAINDNDIVEVADALTDILVVTYGAGAAFGIDLDKCFNEVHRSNMSKLSEEGKPIYNEFGKVMKGPNYSPPDLKKII